MPKLHGGRMPRRLTPAILAVGLLLSAVAQASAGSYDLSVEKVRVERGGTTRTVIGYNGRSPGETLHFREGEDVTIRVTNRLDVPTSIHWHGMIVPTGMDGVPGLSYPGIAPGETFTYRFPVVQSGTYWFHSHSAQQEQDGAYGSIVIAPAGRDPFRYDRDYVVLLSDAHEQSGSEILSNLKRMPDYYNRQQRTLGDFFRDVSEKGLGATLADRKAWGEMRMMPTDITDVQGYRFLINGEDAGQNWTGLFAPGERIRLRFINASAMSYFDVRIPSLKMTVVQADGNDVQPVTVDEFRIAVAETYDVIVRPEAARAYTLFAAAMDRSGYARGTLAPHAGMSAAIPALGSPPLLTMADMGGMPGMEGMGHGAMAGMDHATTPGMAPASPAPDAGGAMAGMDHSKMPGMAPASPAPDAGGAMAGMDHSKMPGMAPASPAPDAGGAMAGMDHSKMPGMAPASPAPDAGGAMAGMDHSKMPGMAPASPAPDAGGAMAGMDHAKMPGMAPASPAPQAGGAMAGMDHSTMPGMSQDGMAGMAPAGAADPFYAPGSGLAPHAADGGKFLSYADLRALHPRYALRPPTREIEIRLTGNMERYIWSIDGVKYEDAEPIVLHYGERVRFKFVNETMMTHPMHLHGMWSILDNGSGQWNPVKHTVSVPPGTTLYTETEVDAPGRWAFHCHLLYHMGAGMFREVRVVGGPQSAALPVTPVQGE